MAHDEDPSYVLGLAITFIILCPIVAGLRVYTRFRLNSKSSLGIDDLLIVLATIMVVGCCITLIIGVKLRALAYPLPKNDPGNIIFSHSERLEFAFFVMQIASMGLTKLSFLFFYRRIFCIKGLRTIFSMIIVSSIILITCWMLAFELWWILACDRNITARWTNLVIYHQKCPTELPSVLGLAISDFLTDLWIILLPIPMVTRLHMQTSRKLIVFAVFALGAVALVASTIRLVIFVHDTRVAAGIITDPTANQDLNSTQGLYWSTLESGLSQIACCLPTLNALIQSPGLRSVMASIRSLSSVGSVLNPCPSPHRGAQTLDSSHDHELDLIVFGRKSGRNTTGPGTGHSTDSVDPSRQGPIGMQIQVESSIEQISEHVKN